MQSLNCPLCLKSDSREYYNATEKVYGVLRNRQYFQCSHCSLIYLNPNQRICYKEEKSRYLEHKNSKSDEKYCQFLLQAWEPLKPYVTKNHIGLDYGCGHQPVLTELLKAELYNVDHYDPLFFETPLRDKYDFIISTEVIEHVFELDVFFKKLLAHLKNGSYLSLMTDWLTDKIDFKNWRYRDDKTHICFFSDETFHFIAREYSLKTIFTDSQRVIIFQKI